MSPYPEWLHWRRLEILHGRTRSGDPQVFRAGSLAISRHGGLRRRRREMSHLACIGPSHAAAAAVGNHTGARILPHLRLKLLLRA